MVFVNAGVGTKPADYLQKYNLNDTTTNGKHGCRPQKKSNYVEL